MKKETAASKLAALLGLNPNDEAVIEATTTKEQKAKKKKDALRGVTLDELDTFRSANAVLLFLQAPELYTARTCKHCKGDFLVSRKFVGYCSYTCLKKELEAIGIDWDTKKPLDEAYVRRVWEHNEPLVIPPAAIKVLQELANGNHSEQEGSRVSN